MLIIRFMCIFADIQCRKKKSRSPGHGMQWPHYKNDIKENCARATIDFCIYIQFARRLGIQSETYDAHNTYLHIYKRCHCSLVWLLSTSYQSHRTWFYRKIMQFFDLTLTLTFTQEPSIKIVHCALVKWIFAIIIKFVLYIVFSWSVYTKL